MHTAHVSRTRCGLPTRWPPATGLRGGPLVSRLGCGRQPAVCDEIATDGSGWCTDDEAAAIALACELLPGLVAPGEMPGDSRGRGLDAIVRVGKLSHVLGMEHWFIKPRQGLNGRKTANAQRSR
ncbi:hypothetical protein CLOM_g18975 [Closterium sp. NIES-68]|nr:hypothetical protein CLOM_g18975 [Closterium sp. NIES-68]GJP66189.1 hypothetical protein CLOP_g23092 [Closterium sp. NIES-67]